MRKTQWAYAMLSITQFVQASALLFATPAARYIIGAAVTVKGAGIGTTRAL